MPYLRASGFPSRVFIRLAEDSILSALHAGETEYISAHAPRTRRIQWVDQPLQGGILKLTILLVLLGALLGGCNNEQDYRNDCASYAKLLLMNPQTPIESRDAITAAWRHCTEPKPAGK